MFVPVSLRCGGGVSRVSFHIQDQVRLLFEGADLLIQLCDSDGIEGGHGHGRDGDSDGDKTFWSSWR